jgi:uncharacterized repeat protein (TIGR03803 family)
MKKNNSLLKKISILTIALFSLGTVSLKAQTISYPLVFAGANGAAPYGTLTLAGSELFGMTLQGGGNLGNIFRMDTDGNYYGDLLDFNGSSNGESPYGSLTLSGHTLFGMTSLGGANLVGCIFSIDTAGGAFKILYDFNYPYGVSPNGDLTILGDKLFGMTLLGGNLNDGTIFSVDTGGGGYKDLYEFNNASGFAPYGDLTISGTTMFGMTDSGGTKGYGTIFSIDTNGANFKVLLNFTGSNGENPYYGAMALSPNGNVLYGMVPYGGKFGVGCIFSIDTDGTAFKNMFNFNNALFNGSQPFGSLTMKGKYLCGMTYAGDTNGYGNIFTIDTVTDVYDDIYDFDGADAANPYGNITFGGSTMYGMTWAGGANSVGTVFKYTGQVLTGLAPAKVTSGSVNVYPNPSHGIFTIQVSGVCGKIASSDMETVEIYNVLGEMVGTQNFVSKTIQMDLSNQPAGIYMYRVVSAENGNLIGAGKLVIN